VFVLYLFFVFLSVMLVMLVLLHFMQNKLNIILDRDDEEAIAY